VGRPRVTTRPWRGALAAQHFLRTSHDRDGASEQHDCTAVNDGRRYRDNAGQQLWPSVDGRRVGRDALAQGVSRACACHGWLPCERGPHGGYLRLSAHRRRPVSVSAQGWRAVHGWTAPRAARSPRLRPSSLYRRPRMARRDLARPPPPLAPTRQCCALARWHSRCS
jgi:hypothetical protein